jgi:polysaccharide pyruvyl transferase WcaK-like protein
MKLVAPFGFYGWGNIGDESTLQGFGRLLADYAEPTTAWVAARSLAQCRRAEPSFRYFSATAERSVRRHWAWRTADAMVVPGGTPIVDVLGRWPFSELAPLIERAVKAGMPIAFIGTGTEHLRSPESKRVVAELLAPNVHAWSVRSQRDKDRLVEYGVPPDAVTPAADMAWRLEPASDEFGRRYLTELGVDLESMVIGVNVNIEGFVRERQPQLLTNLAGFLDEVVRRYGATVLFLCNEVRDGETFDLAASREIIAGMCQKDRTTIVPNRYWLPQEMRSMVACCRLTISTRYHFCLFSALQGVPFLAIERSDKVGDLVADLDWSFGLSLQELQVPNLLAKTEEMERGRTTWLNVLRTSVQRMKGRSLKNADVLAALADPVGAASR